MKSSHFPLLSLLLLGVSFMHTKGENTVQIQNQGFEENISLQGVSFLIQCSNQGSINTLTITPSGLERKNEPIVVEVEGSVTNAEADDLDANGFPEIYIYIRCAL